MFTTQKMNDRQRFLNVMDYKPVDKVPNIEVGVWAQTKQRWLNEGLDEKSVNWDWWIGDSYFGIDPRVYININYDMIPPFEYKLIEKTDRYEIYRDRAGVVHKALIEGTTNGMRMCMDQYISFPVSNMQDFREMKKRYIMTEKRYPENWKEKLLPGWKVCDKPLILARNCSTLGFFWLARKWMGTENVCYAWYDEPEMMHEMMEFIADYTIEVSKPALSEGLDIDYVMINEDMSMKNGPLVGPDKYKEFIEPHMKRLVDFFKSNGVKYVMVDTDGNCEALIPLLMDCGVDAIWPLERASDMDPVRIRKKFGKELRLYGGVDKRRIALGREEIDLHLSELMPLIEEGGFIPTVDHAVSPEVSLEDFKYYMKRKEDLLTGRF